MKKFLTFFLLFALLTLPVFALADSVVLNGDAFFDWAQLGTFSGAVAVVVFLVQLLKLPADKVWKIPTQYIVYLVSLAVLILAQVFTGDGFHWGNLVLCLFNAALVALSAMSAYDLSIGKVEQAKAKKTEATDTAE